MSALRLPLALILFGVVSASGAEELKTLSGKNVSGYLRSIDSTNIVFDTDAGRVETPLSQALLLDLHQARPVPADAKYFDVRLLDDSNILAKEITYSPTSVQLTLLSGAALKVPLNSLVTVLRDGQDPAIRKQFQNLTKNAKFRSDRILLYKDGELNALEGTLGAIDPDGKAINFTREGGQALKPNLDKLQGMVFLRTEVPVDTPLCKVIDQDGNSFVASKLSYEGGNLVVITPAGAKIAMKNDALARLDFNLGRLTYLSDLEPVKLSESPFFAGFPSLRRDVNQDGRPIVLLDRNFAKGLTLEGGTQVEFNLNGKYKDLKALIGADTRTAEGAFAKTTVTVYCDGTKRLSETVVPTELRPIALNVKDVGTLRIVVEGPNFTGLSAYVTLADARVSQ
jgi:hypothetical protein